MVIDQQMIAAVRYEFFNCSSFLTFQRHVAFSSMIILIFFGSN
jgi:hypothetical protein